MGLFDGIKKIVGKVSDFIAPVTGLMSGNPWLGSAISAIGGAWGAQRQQDASKAMSREQMDFQSSQASTARDFNERMSSTAHQRQVADLRAAGLNPILSAGGSGASSPSSPSPQGAMGQAQNIGAAGVQAAIQAASAQSQIQLQTAQTAKVQAETNPVEYWKGIAESLGIDVGKLAKLLGIELDKFPADQEHETTAKKKERIDVRRRLYQNQFKEEHQGRVNPPKSNRKTFPRFKTTHPWHKKAKGAKVTPYPPGADWATSP